MSFKLEPVGERRALSAVARILLWLLHGYRCYVSPLTPSSCRFYPTCSQYAVEAVTKYGALRGGWLALRRVLRCHPLNPGGYDPVP